jgi:hypothetical protein
MSDRPMTSSPSSICRPVCLKDVAPPLHAEGKAVVSEDPDLAQPMAPCSDFQPPPSHEVASAHPVVSVIASIFNFQQNPQIKGNSG